MTDKQIIIDGVDVSGCEWIREVGLDSEYICTCNSPNKTSGYCKYNPNCRYKELKAKEQECEKLKENLPNAITRLMGELDQLKAENDELMKQHQADKGLITSTGKQNYQLLQEYDKLKTENDNIKETFDGLFKVQYKLADNNKKLRQCLTEIKEIAKNGCYDDCGMPLDELSIILQKISECEGNYE